MTCCLTQIQRRFTILCELTKQEKKKHIHTHKAKDLILDIKITRNSGKPNRMMASIITTIKTRDINKTRKMINIRQGKEGKMNTLLATGNIKRPSMRSTIGNRKISTKTMISEKAVVQFSLSISSLEWWLPNFLSLHSLNTWKLNTRPLTFSEKMQEWQNQLRTYHNFSNVKKNLAQHNQTQMYNIIKVVLTLMES